MNLFVSLLVVASPAVLDARLDELLPTDVPGDTHFEGTAAVYQAFVACDNRVVVPGGAALFMDEAQSAQRIRTGPFVVSKRSHRAIGPCGAGTYGGWQPFL